MSVGSTSPILSSRRDKCNGRAYRKPRRLLRGLNPLNSSNIFALPGERDELEQRNMWENSHDGKTSRKQTSLHVDITKIELELFDKNEKSDGKAAYKSNTIENSDREAGLSWSELDDSLMNCNMDDLLPPDDTPNVLSKSSNGVEETSSEKFSVTKPKTDEKTTKYAAYRSPNSYQIKVRKNGIRSNESKNKKFKRDINAKDIKFDPTSSVNISSNSFANKSDKTKVNEVNKQPNNSKPCYELDSETLAMFNESFDTNDIIDKSPFKCNLINYSSPARRKISASAIAPPSPDLFSDNLSSKTDMKSVDDFNSQEIDDFTQSQMQAAESLFGKEDNNENSSPEDIKPSSEFKSPEPIINGKLSKKDFTSPENFCSTFIENKTIDKKESIGQSSQMSAIVNESLESQNMMNLICPPTLSSQKTVNSSCTQATLDTSAVKRTEAIEAAVTNANKVSTEGSVGYELGPFFGLPTTVKDLIYTHRGINKLYDWQEKCVKKGVPGDNLLISLPTSGGKTLVAEILMLRTLLIKKKHAIFVLPYVAIVQEKVRGLSPLSLELEFLLEEYAGSKGSYPPKLRIKKNVAFVATIEKASGLINSFLEEGRMQEVGMVVVDEAHMIGEGGGRGALLEGLITKLNYCAKHVQVVAMSATISNLRQLASFMRADLFTDQFRPVELKQYVKFHDQIAEINTAALTDEELLTGYRPFKLPICQDEKTRDADGIATLVREVIPQHSVLVFCSTRNNCESVAKLLASLLSRELKQHKTEEKIALYKALTKEGDGVICPVLKRVLPYGVAYHHSGLTEAERKLIEEGYLTGTLCVITCTSTLAAGINLPARRVILRSPYTGRTPLTRSRYTQMVGRAGRAGLDSCGESFLVMQPKDIAMVPGLVRGPVEKCMSQLFESTNDTTSELSTSTFAHATKFSQDIDTTLDKAHFGAIKMLTSYSGLRDLIFSSIGLSLTLTPDSVIKMVQCSLFALQAKEIDFNVEEIIYDILQKLRECSMLRIKDSSFIFSSENFVSQPKPSSSSQVERESEERLKEVLKPQHQLSVSRLGRAAVKGCVELSISKRLYDDLILARNSLAVTSRLHLLYLVTPYTAAQEIKLHSQAFYDAFTCLSAEDVKVATIIGINESVVSRVARNRIKESEKDMVMRFNSALIIHRLTSGESVWRVSERFEVPRGILQRTMSAASAFASCVNHFCQELEELWAFKVLLPEFSRQLQGCCSAHLLPLMDLPAVKIGRAKLLHSAGFTNLSAVANATPEQLVQTLHHLPKKTAVQLIQSAKALLLEKAEALQEEAEQMLLGISNTLK